MKIKFIKSYTILIAWNCLVLCMPTNEWLLNANCNKKEIAKAIFFTYGTKPQTSFCITKISNGTSENALRTNIIMLETCAKPENKQIGCYWFICICLFAYIE